MMKAVVVALMLVAGALARTAVQDKNVKAEGPACPFADPFISQPGLLNLTLPPILWIDEGSNHGGLTVFGLSGLFYEYDINVILLTANAHITLPSLEINTPSYRASGTIDATPFSQATLPSGPFTGAGFATINAKNVDVKFSATLFINLIGNKVSVRVMDIENLTFDSLALNFDGFTVAGEVIDWAAWNPTFKANFDRELAANKAAVTEKIRLAVNEVVGKYTLGELIDLIGGIGGGEGGECATVA